MKKRSPHVWPKQETNNPLVAQFSSLAKEKGLSLFEVSEAAGYHDHTVYYILRGRHVPKLQTMQDLFQAIGYELTIKPMEATE